MKNAQHMMYAALRDWSMLTKKNISKIKTDQAKKKILFVSCNGLKKNRVGRSGIFFKSFWSEMCVLCMFYIDSELGGQKKL